MLRQRDARHRFARRLEIQQQRNDRMPVRRNRQLALAALAQRREARHDAVRPARRSSASSSRRCCGREAAALRGERGDARVRAAHGLAEPRQVIPDREIVNELVRGVRNALGRRERLRDAWQARGTGRSARSSACAARAGTPSAARAARPDRCGTGPGPSSASTGSGSGVPWRRCAVIRSRELLELLDEHRREIHHGARGRLRLQMRRHVDVVLDGVQVRPGQHVLAREGIAILRLVHVPQQHDRQARGGSCRCQ